MLKGVSEDIQRALDDLEDFEVQAIKKKYSKRALNPIKNKKNKQLLIEEVQALLDRRKIERIREERRLEMEHRKEVLLETVGKTKEHIGNNSRVYSIIGAIALVLFAGFSNELASPRMGRLGDALQ